MSKNEIPTQVDGEQTRDCDRCGRDRPQDPDRFTITASDYSESTVAYERALLCVECWRHFRDQLRRCVA